MKLQFTIVTLLSLCTQSNSFQLPSSNRVQYRQFTDNIGLSFVAAPTNSKTCLYNVPPPSVDDPEALKDAADRESPPASFFELQINSARAAQAAINDGYKLLEVEVNTHLLY